VPNAISRTSKASLCSLCLLCSTLVAPSIAQAGDLFITTEVLLEEQGTNAEVLGFLFGADSTSSLSFTSFVDPSGNSFSYSTVAGSHYLGQRISLTGSGTIDASGNYDVTASLDLGGTLLQIAGKETVSPDGHIVTSEKDETNKDVKTGDTHYKGEIGQPNDTSKIVEGWQTDAKGEHVSKSDFGGTDKYDKTTDDWVFTIVPNDLQQQNPPPFVFSFGFSPAGGGDGTFTATISTVPEPPTITLSLLSTLVLLTYFRLRQAPRQTLTSKVSVR
jgi:hypothetical protein